MSRSLHRRNSSFPPTMPIMVVSALAMSLLIGSPASRALYVADFSAAERGDSGKLGGVWLVRPNSR